MPRYIIELDKNLSPLKDFPVSSKIEYYEELFYTVVLLNLAVSFMQSTLVSARDRKVKTAGCILARGRQMRNSIAHLV